MTTRSIPCLFARAGTSRGAFFLEEDLPADPALRSRVILSIYGSPDRRQIDGIGGGDALTSKVAVVGRSARSDVDVDYTFGQVGIETGDVFWVGNCGNMSSGVGPFAIRRGLVPAVSPVTTVRIYNTNTQKVLVAEVPVDEQGEVVEEGDAEISGVPGTGAPILLDFGDCGGAVTGSLLPTGNPTDTVRLGDGTSYSISIVDATTPFIFVDAAEVGMSGIESPAEIDQDADLLARLENLRAHAARLIGLVGPGEVAREVSPSIPRIVAVSPARSYVASDGTTVAAEKLSVVARQQSMQRTHKTYAVTGAVCTAVAGAIEGTVVHRLAADRGEYFVIGHPGGLIAAQVDVSLSTEIRVKKASIVRTARAILDGVAFVPQSAWATLQEVLSPAQP